FTLPFACFQFPAMRSQFMCVPLSVIQHSLYRRAGSQYAAERSRLASWKPREELAYKWRELLGAQGTCRHADGVAHRTHAAHSERQAAGVGDVFQRRGETAQRDGAFRGL